jgi:hypothetical protein
VIARDEDQIVAALGEPVGIDRSDSGRSASDKSSAFGRLC